MANKAIESEAVLTPLPAATVTLVRDGAQGLEVLMMRRNLQSGFVPGHHVFRGGAVDEHDGSEEVAPLCAGLDDQNASAILGVASGGLAYWVAALREAFEEAGLLLAYSAGGEIIELVQPQAVERFSVHRRAIDDGMRTFAAVLGEENLRLATDRLVYFAHWITPVGRSRRYDTRFFIAEAPPSQEALSDRRETIDHVWITPGAALDKERRREFEMRLPTVRTLELFAQFERTASLLAAMRKLREVPAILPRPIGRERYLLPGDPGYEEAGEVKSKRTEK